MILCERCGCKVDVEKELPQYPFYCPNCYENMYGIECFDTNDLKDILYGLYLHEWCIRRNDVRFADMEPAYWTEFMDNEFWDEEYMVYLLSLYGQWHRITEYRKMIKESE